MIIKLLAQQIPTYWEIIKYATTVVDNVQEKDRRVYLNRLLQSLLNDKSQCFIRFDEDRVLDKLMVTKIMGDKITEEKHLSIECLYAFKTSTDQEWTEEFVFIRQFADKEQCLYILFESPHKRIWEIGKLIGFKEKYRVFILKIGGTS